MYNEAVFSTFAKLYNHHYHLILNILIVPRGNPMPIKWLFPFPQGPSLWRPLICSLSPWTRLFWTFPIGGIIEWVDFCVWLLALSTMFWRVFHDVVRINISFLFKAEWYSPVHIEPICSSLDGQWNCSPFLPTVDGAAMDIHVQIFVGTHVSLLLGDSAGAKWLHHVVLWQLIFWGTAQLFHSRYTILHSQQQWMSNSISSPPWTHVLFSMLFMIAILAGVKWLVIMVLICISLTTLSIFFIGHWSHLLFIPFIWLTFSLYGSATMVSSHTLFNRLLWVIKLHEDRNSVCFVHYFTSLPRSRSGIVGMQCISVE